LGPGLAIHLQKRSDATSPVVYHAASDNALQIRLHLGTSFTIVDVKGNEIDTVYSIGRMFDISSIYAYVSALGKNGTFSYQESIKFREGFSDIVPFFDVASVSKNYSCYSYYS
jgi:hypothetical protein